MELIPIQKAKMGVQSPKSGTTAPRETPTKDGNFYDNQKDYSKWSPVAGAEVNRFHQLSDVDLSHKSQHHTLGPRRNQASPGDHIHDGRESRKLGTGLGLTLTGSKGGNVALANLITMLKTIVEFTDNTT